MGCVRCGAYLACLLFNVVLFTASESQQKEKRIDNSLAVVGRIFVYTLAKVEDNQGTFEVSKELGVWC